MSDNKMDSRKIKISPVICVDGDFDKMGNFILGNVKAAARFDYGKDIPFLEKEGVIVTVKETDHFPRIDFNMRRYNVFKSDNGVVQMRDIPLFGQAFISLGDLHGITPVVEWNPLFRYWSSLPITKIGSVGYHVETVIALRLLEAGMILVHGGAVSSNGRAIIFTGLPNQGKTHSVIQLIREGYNFLAEDVCIVSKTGEVFALPFTTSFKHVTSIGDNIKRTLLDIVPDLNLEATAFLGRVVILEKSEQNLVRGLSTEEATRKILLINQLEFNYSMNVLIRTYLALHSLSPVSHLMTLEQEIINRAIRDVEVILVSFTEHSSRALLLAEVLK